MVTGWVDGTRTRFCHQALVGNGACRSCPQYWDGGSGWVMASNGGTSVENGVNEPPSVGRGTVRQARPTAAAAAASAREKRAIFRRGWMGSGQRREQLERGQRLPAAWGSGLQLVHWRSSQRSQIRSNVAGSEMRQLGRGRITS